MKKQILTVCLLLGGALACTERSATSSHPGSAPALASSSKPVSSKPEVIDPSADEAMEVMPDVLGLSHQDLGSPRHLERLAELKAQGDRQAALLEGRKALFDDPADPEALLETAQLARAVDEKELAALAYERLGDLTVDDAAPLVQHARILLELNDLEGALRVAADAVARDELNPEAHHVLGRAQLSAKKLGPAIASLETTLELSPDHPYALNNLGFALLGANRNEEAVDVLERASELLPGVAWVHNNLGVAYERMGRTAEARLAYEDALSAAPRYLKARLNAERMDKEVAQLELEAPAANAEPEEPTP